MLLFQAIVLGVLQGLTEFLPVSSSGHLQGVPYLLGWDRGGSLAFDVLVHAGSLVAVLVYFREDLLDLARGALARHGDRERRRRSLVLVGLLAVGSVPAAGAGLLFADVFEAAFDSPRLVAVFLYLTAVLLWSAERLRANRIRISRATVAPAGVLEGAVTVDDIGRDIGTIRVRDAALIGTAQALAIFPGISRAGSTIAAGMALGLSRTAAARFSFLLSIPVILGATAVTLPELGTPEPGALPFGPVELTAGALAAALSGYWAIRTLLAIVSRRDLLGFARYVAVFATILLLATFVRG